VTVDRLLPDHMPRVTTTDLLESRTAEAGESMIGFGGNDAVSVRPICRSHTSRYPSSVDDNKQLGDHVARSQKRYQPDMTGTLRRVGGPPSDVSRSVESVKTSTSAVASLALAVILSTACADGGSASVSSTTIEHAYECQSLARAEVEGLLNVGTPEQAFAVKSQSRSAGGRAVYAVRLDRSGRSYILLHDAAGSPGTSGWGNGMWAGHDSASAGATGFPLNSSLASPYPTDAVAAVRNCG